jgi:hypothetical protein
MFTCYFDEAGGKDHGFIAVCGYVASVEEWQQFEANWKHMLADHQVPYLHMLGCAHFKGPYKKWEKNPDDRAAFIADAARVIRDTVRCGYLCAVHYADFDNVNQRYELRERLSSPYALAGRFCIGRANTWMKGSGRALSEIDYVFEDGGPDVSGLARVVQEAKLQIPSFRPSRDTRIQDATVQLQAADLFAYELRKAVVDHGHNPFTSPERFRKSFQALFDVDVEQGNYHEAELIDLCEIASISKRSI